MQFHFTKTRFLLADTECIRANNLHASSPVFSPEQELLSGGSDGAICYWKYDASLDRWIMDQRLIVSTEETGGDRASSELSISSLCCLQLPDETFIAVCSGTDGSITLLVLQDGKWEPNAQCRVPPKQLVETLDICVLPGFEQAASLPTTPAEDDTNTGVLLAAGGVDSRIRLYTLKWNDQKKLAFLELLVLKGHLDWIRSLQFSFAPFQSETLQESPDGAHIGDVILASASQDCKIRLWRIRCTTLFVSGQSQREDELVDDTVIDSLDDEGDSELAMSTLNNPLVFSIRLPNNLKKQWAKDIQKRCANGGNGDGEKFDYRVAKEAVLIGHEGWVCSVKWFPPVCTHHNQTPVCKQPAALVSTAQDKSTVIWSPGSSGVWIPAVRFGTPRSRGVGYFGVAISPFYNTIVAYDHRGAFFGWKTSSESLESVSEATWSNRLQQTHWSSIPTVSGHFGPVNDICWDRFGRYLLSASSDKTIRLFCSLATSRLGAVSRSGLQWQEINRPQTHGYSMICLTLPPIKDRPHTLVSGGDEKILRVFDAPTHFISTLRNLGLHCEEADEVSRPSVAYVPELHLSNKGTTEDFMRDAKTVEDYLHEEQRMKELARNERQNLVGDTGVPEEYSASDRSEMSRGMHNSRKVRNNPDTKREKSETSEKVEEEKETHTSREIDVPTEDMLSENTLWAERQKLYGHGNELLCVASSNDGKFIASACKAKHPPDAVVRLWRTDTWIQEQELQGHDWSVVQLQFSPTDEFLVSVSKDRQFCVFQRQGNSESPQYTRLATVKAHKRIIWTVSFAPKGYMFATGSRDGTIKLWNLETEGDNLGLHRGYEFEAFPCGVTALAFAPTECYVSEGSHSNAQYLAIGFEDGSVQLYKGLSEVKRWDTWDLVSTLSYHDSHCSSVTRLSWRPQSSISNTGPNEVAGQLSSCSSDGSVRIYNVRFPS